MKNHEKLRKVIEYAVERGWGNAWQKSFFEHWSGDNSYYFVSYHPGLKNFRYESLSLNKDFAEAVFGSILFDRDFAKAVFGEDIEHEFDFSDSDEKCKNCGLSHRFWTGENCRNGWITEIQTAVISEDPIEYYYNFIQEQWKTMSQV